MSSNDIVKSVSKKLKYYFEVKRREDGFDLSGPDCPRLDHPPTRARSTLQYDGLHDRPLKHYFSPHTARTILTQFKVPDDCEEKEKTLKKKVVKHVKRYQFLPSSLPDTYYRGKGGRRTLRPETVGYGVSVKRQKEPHKGSYPVLRSTPNSYLTRGEANRLVNMATRLLVATETIDLKNEETENKYGQRSRPSTAKKDGKLPQIEEEGSQKKDATGGGKKPKYTYDIHGRRVPVQEQKYEEDADSSYGTHPSSAHNSYLTIDGDVADDKKVPVWLKKEMKEQNLSKDEKEDKWIRPHSAKAPAKKNKRPPSSGKSRPKSAASPKQHKPAQPKDLPLSVQPAAWDLEVCSSAHEEEEEDKTSAPPSRKSSQVQTPGELLKNYDPMERVIWDGEPGRYRLHVFTGSRLGSSTKAEVKVALCGDNGRTEEIWLHEATNHKVKFQKGQEDIFDLDTFYVGALKKIKIGHDRQELGYGWFLDKVFVKDRVRCVRYEVPCDKWLSAKEGDGSTVKEFEVQTYTTYSEQEPSEAEFSTQTPEPVIHIPSSTTQEKEGLRPGSPPLPDENASHTSVNTIPSVTQDRERRPSLSSTASSYSSTASSYTTESSRSDSPTPRAHTPTPPPTARRKDDFFDQSVPEKDYASVIESMTDGRENDFKNDDDLEQKHHQQSYGGQSSNQGHLNTTVTLTLNDVGNKEEDGENKQKSQSVGMYDGLGDVTDSEADTARITVDEDTDLSSRQPETQANFMDGFKAGIEAAKRSQQDEDGNETDEKEEKLDVSTGPSIQQAAKTGNIDRVKQLVEHNSTLALSKDERGWSPLHIGASQGHREVVQYLSVNVTDIDSATPTGYTPIHLAAMEGHTSCVMVLAAMGAQISSKTVDQRTPLHLAAKGGHIETVKWLVANRAQLGQADSLGSTSLDLAEQYSHQEVVTFLQACLKEQQDPQSSLSQLRTKARNREINYPSASTSDSSTDSSSDSSYTSSDTNDQTWVDDKKPVSSKRPRSAKGSRHMAAEDTTESEMDEKAKEKHDQEIENKRRLYEEQQQKMATGHTSFLDSIRNELEA